MSDEGPSHLDLFSGIGGFALAARWSGWRTVAFSEIDPYACRVLERQFPGVPNLGDIRNVRAVRADLVTGGFPCQPYSLAGKRRGTGDDRALWPEMFRVIGETRPTWMLGENVPGIINLELDRVLSDLESIGYAAWPIGIPACAVDARHRRERIWIVAYSEHERWHAAALHRKSASDDRGQTKPEEEAEQSTGSDPLANAHGERREGQRLHHSKPVLKLAGAVREFPTPTATRRSGLQSHGVNVISGSLNPVWVEWLMGYPAGWTDCGVSATRSSHKSRPSSSVK
ncbi:MAG: C-5 cytosine-specific DNA methylase [Anaerolineales bacterium]|nr:C-5 cytosine-specific DNA methylase [Anaerolineales bacterium]